MAPDSPSAPGPWLPSSYEQVLDAAPDALVLLGAADGLISLVSLQTEKILGFQRSELLGQSFELLIPERFRAGHKIYVARFIERPVARPMGSGLDLFALRKDGTEVPVEISLGPVLTPEGLHICAAIRDVTERKRVESATRTKDLLLTQELREARRAAEAASAAKSEFLSSMSHELRTPLNAILGFAQLLQRDRKEPLSDRHRERASQILKGGEHLLRLIDDILDLSRIEAGRVSISTEAVNVREVVDEVRTTLEPLASRAGVRLEVAEMAPDLPNVAADRTRLAQIVMNFGSNALKYNRPGGTATIRISLPGEGRVRVSVADTGIGIPVDKQDKLFQPFQRAGQETGPIEGTGIGLVITKRLAELMGGRVGFQSSPGVGSEFWVELAIRQGVALPSPAATDEQKRTPLGTRRLVVYVEDNPANVTFMRDLLAEFEALELVTAPTAEMGIELARGRRPDLVIMDINLPGISGVEALRILREDPSTRDIPVIAMTAAAAEKERQRGLQLGFYQYLTKPVKVDELIAVLETLFAEKT